MTYDNVVKLITPEFIGECCKLSKAFKKHKTHSEYEQIAEITREIATAKSKKQKYSIKNFESLLFEAWIGWNRVHKESGLIIDLNYDSCMSFDNNGSSNVSVFYYSGLIPKRPLSPEIQALVCVLSNAIKRG